MSTWLRYLIELHDEKDLAYGDAWCRRGETAGIFPNVARKYDRWARIRQQHSEVVAGVEPLDDTLADLLIYSAKYLLWLLERHPGEAEALPVALPAETSVAEALTLVSTVPLVNDPGGLIISSFGKLEAGFLAGAAEYGTPRDRVEAVWSLAVSAWAELSVLPVPGGSGHTRAVPVRPSSAAVTTARDLCDQLLAAFTSAPGPILLLGLTPTALELSAELRTLGLAGWVIGIAQPGLGTDENLTVVDWEQVSRDTVSYLVVATDEDKEDLLRTYVVAAGTATPLPRVILSGVAHMAFRDPLYAELDAPAMVPSYATGYPYTRVHMFEYLRAAAANGLSGAIVELGAFKGGTTAWLARVARRLNLDVPILAFDSWEGFPPRRSMLDMYAHPRCVFNDLRAVRSYLEPLGVEIIAGDISYTAPSHLKDVPILLAFIDTDNYSPAAAALTIIAENVVPGGAIMFDHYTTTEDYIYTLGERMAAQNALYNRGFLHLHGTGLFTRLPTAETTASPSPERRPAIYHHEGYVDGT
jgi:hypothetical protein